MSPLDLNPRKNASVATGNTHVHTDMVTVLLRQLHYTHRLANAPRCSNAPGAIDCSPADWTSSEDRSVKFTRVDWLIKGTDPPTTIL